MDIACGNEAICVPSGCSVKGVKNVGEQVYASNIIYYSSHDYSSKLGANVLHVDLVGRDHVP